jgi:hypothetical protein
MTLKVWLSILVCGCMFIMSATTISVANETSIVTTDAPAMAMSQVSSATHLNFVQRLFVKAFSRKLEKQLEKIDKPVTQEEADKQAENAKMMGIISLSTFIGALFLPFFILIALPTSIIAITKGERAIKNGTTNVKAAKQGKTFGLISLIGTTVLIVAALVVLAVILKEWN